MPNRPVQKLPISSFVPGACAQIGYKESRGFRNLAHDTFRMTLQTTILRCKTTCSRTINDEQHLPSEFGKTYIIAFSIFDTDVVDFHTVTPLIENNYILLYFVWGVNDSR
jgi:hypothetical protein